MLEFLSAFGKNKLRGISPRLMIIIIIIICLINRIAVTTELHGIRKIICIDLITRNRI